MKVGNNRKKFKYLNRFELHNLTFSYFFPSILSWQMYLLTSAAGKYHLIYMGCETVPFLLFGKKKYNNSRSVDTHNSS